MSSVNLSGEFNDKEKMTKTQKLRSILNFLVELNKNQIKNMMRKNLKKYSKNTYA